VTRDDPNLAAGFWASSAKARSRCYVLLRSKSEITLGT